MTHWIELRSPEPHHDDETVLIHMGAGAVESVVANAVNNYHHYRGLRPGDGAFGMLCVSIFGVVSGVTREDIFAGLPQGQFGEATWGEVRAVFDVLATTIHDDNMPPAIAALQRAHFDIVLEHPEVPDLETRDPVDLDDAATRNLEQAVAQQVRGLLLPLFVPRGPKYPRS